MTESDLLAATKTAKARMEQLETQIDPLKRKLFAATTYEQIATAEDFVRGHETAARVRVDLDPLVDEQTKLRHYKATCHAKLDYLRRYGTALVRRGVPRGEKVVSP